MSLRSAMNDRGAAYLAAMLGGLLGVTPVSADRMYRWVDPATGTLQFAGKPPSWYRNSQPGPRVRVYEKGEVIDDTAAVPSAHADAPAPIAAPRTSPEDVPPDVLTPVPASTRIEAFKALLEAWDKEQARASSAKSATSSPVTAPPAR